MTNKQYLPIPTVNDSGLRIAPAPELPTLDFDPDEPFPTECLPDGIREMVKAVAAQERTTEALPACCAIATISASLGSAIRVASGPNRWASPNLYILVGANSGTGKSRVFSQIVSPFIERDNSLLSAWQMVVRPGILGEERQIKAQLKQLEKASDQSGSNAEEFRRLHAKLEQLKKELEMEPKLFVSDVTTQQLAVLMQNPTETMASLSADARDTIDNITGRYHEKGSPDMDIYLKTWSGDPVIVDRTSRPSVRLSAPRLASLWLVQPDKIAALFNHPTMIESGFLPRCLLCQSNTPLTRMGDEAEVAVPSDIQQRWHALVGHLLDTYRLRQFPEGDGKRRPTPHEVKATPGATLLLRDYFNETIGKRIDGTYSDAEEFSARWTEQAWRLALLFHAAEYANQQVVVQAFPTNIVCLGYTSEANAKTTVLSEISERTVAAAIRVVRWFANHQLAVLEASRQRNHAERWRKIDELLAKNTDGITARDLVTYRIASDSPKAKILLQQLEDKGVLVSEERKPTRGGHPTVVYRRDAPIDGSCPAESKPRRSAFITIADPADPEYVQQVGTTPPPEIKESWGSGEAIPEPCVALGPKDIDLMSTE